ILRELKRRGTPLYALTNWSHETFPLALERFEFLGWFDGVVVSGQERVIKPDPRIYHLLVKRHGLRPDEIVFIDDNPANAAAATTLGMHGIHFVNAGQLRGELSALGLGLAN
ncbi:MAG TPA: HAD-IA family hydrolase, partial [Candidatus Udaeobacter sp.]|nr:HAD-IA family hydrolase [Candidatus Udaeobacter sp.]